MEVSGKKQGFFASPFRRSRGRGAGPGESRPWGAAAGGGAPAARKKTSAFLKILLAFSPGFCYYNIRADENKHAVCDSGEVQWMAKCEYCGKGVTFGIQVSHSHRRSNRPWKPNVKRVKAIVDGSPRHVYVCTRCMRSGKVTRAV